MPLPDFIIAGAQKSGTTTLHDVLKTHPQVFMAEEKEVCFFNKDENFSRGIEWYKSFFKSAGNDCKVGESTPDYLWDIESAQRMYSALPDVKLIFLLRNPADRAYSSYWHAVRYGREHKTFEQAIAIENERIQSCAVAWRYNAYVSRGDYTKQLKRFLEYYQPENVLVKTFEQYKNSPEKEIVSILQFLGLSCSSEITSLATTKRSNIAYTPRSIKLQRIRPLLEKIHPKVIRVLDGINLTSKKYPPMRSESRNRLVQHFLPMRTELEGLLGRRLTEWDK